MCFVSFKFIFCLEDKYIFTQYFKGIWVHIQKKSKVTKTFDKLQIDGKL